MSETWRYESISRQILGGLVNPDLPQRGYEVIAEEVYVDHGRRICAAINAVQGIPTETLERGSDALLNALIERDNSEWKRAAESDD